MTILQNAIVSLGINIRWLAFEKMGLLFFIILENKYELNWWCFNFFKHSKHDFINVYINCHEWAYSVEIIKWIAEKREKKSFAYKFVDDEN